MKSIVWLAIAAFGIVTAWSTWFSVDVTQSAIVTRFGNPLRKIEEPGFQWKLPLGIERVVYFDNRLLVLDMPGPDEPAREFLTNDKKNIEVSCYTCWKIADPLKFLEAVGSRPEAEAVLGHIVRAELGSMLVQHPFSSFLSTDPNEV